MALQYTTLSENTFSGGIDARSAENQIVQGYLRDLLNGDILKGRARKRKGYQGFAGTIPVRVTGLTYKNGTPDEVCFTLDSAVSLASDVDLNSVRSSPIVVYGRSSTFTGSQGPFTTSGDVAKYYTEFHVPTRKSLAAGTGTLFVPGSEHALGTTNMFVDIVQATSSSNQSYETVMTTDLNIDESTYGINIDYTVGSTTDAFVFFEDKTPVLGSSYVATINHTGSGIESFSIPAGTHNLSNYNIIAQLQEDNGSTRSRVLPYSMTISNTGDVDIDIDSSYASDFYLILSAAPATNIASGNIAGNTTDTIVLTGLTSPFIFFGIYLELTAGGDIELVQPDKIEYNDTTTTATITFTNSTSSAKNFRVYYEYGALRSNQLCVYDTVTVSGSDLAPQLSIWGLEHSEIYKVKSRREGWVNHIDSYRRSGEQRVVTGLGGNLFTNRTFSEVGTAYKYGKLYPRLNNRTDANYVLGPVFWETSETPALTRGYITSTDGGTNWVTVSSVQYDTGNGYTKYTLEIPNKAILDSTGTPTTLASVISTTANLEDYLTVKQMSYARHNGTFKIKQLLDDTDKIHIWVENTSNSADYNDLYTGGMAGVFTDKLGWLSTSTFLADDKLYSAIFDGSNYVISVRSSSTTFSVIDGVDQRIDVAPGLFHTGQRTSSIIPLRTANPGSTASVENMVRGDMLSYTEIDRLLKIKFINADTDRTVNISSTDGVATVTLTSGDTANLLIGMKVVLLSAGDYSGTQTVTDILSPTEFTFDTDSSATVSSATLIGNYIEVDEELQWRDREGDANALTVDERWIPIEAPDDSYNLTPTTHVRYFDQEDYGNQDFLRSVMVVDNMYFTNSKDEVYKFDGTNMYRSGIIPWQPGLFMIEDTGSTAKIVVDNPVSTPTAVSAGTGNVFTVPLGDENKFPVGSRVRHSYTGGFNDYDVLSSYNDGTDGFVKVRRKSTSAITLGSSPVITLLSVYRYYFRCNAIDANDNIIASAITGYQDHIMELAADAAVRIRLVGIPTWDVYDYDRLEVEIYRTKLQQVAPFYKVTTLRMEFDNDNGYVDYTDVFSDTDLTQLDPVNSVLLGQELGTRWSDPLRAKYVTSTGNRLVLANVKDYPELDIQIIADGSIAASTFDSDTITFRRNNAGTGTVTDMVDTVVYEWKPASSAKTVSGITGVAGTSFEVTTSTDHGASVGDWVYLYHSAVPTAAETLTYSGWWQIAEVGSTTTFTVNYAGSEGSPAGVPDKCLLATDPTNIPVLTGTDGNMGMFNGNSSLLLFNVARRLAMAINATMRKVDTSIAGMEDFIPWLTARSGNDITPAGRLIVRQPRAEDVNFEMVLGTFSGYDIFVNDVRRSSADQISASTKIYPSRLLVSYENYPEIFDAPTVVIDTESDSTIDINSADGQEITGVIPFFGDTAFGAALQGAVLVVFKTNSIYLVDINEKAAGRNPVQRIETEGLGCTAPYSIAVTKKGIMFANESGIYCLRRDQSIQYIGEYMERNWTEAVDQDFLNVVQGHHYGVGRQYKISVPIKTGVDSMTGYNENDQVYVYDHTSEDQQGVGAWSRYDNHPATGWTNLSNDAYFGSTNGQVYSIRRVGDETDYRDDSSSIDFQLVTRALDFGTPGIRKVIDKVVVHYRSGARSEGTTLSTSVELQQEFSTTGVFVIEKPAATTGIDDRIPQDIETIAHSIGRRKSVYLQIKVENSTIDENVEIAGMDFKVAGLSTRGIKQAAGTK